MSRKAKTHPNLGNPEWLAEMYEANTMGEIAKMLGVPVTKVSHALHEFGIENRKPNPVASQPPISKATIEAIIREFLTTDMTVKELAAKYNACAYTLNQWVKGDKATAIYLKVRKEVGLSTFDWSPKGMASNSSDYLEEGGDEEPASSGSKTDLSGT